MFKVFIFGTGQGAEKVLDTINFDHVEVIGYLDNNETKVGLKHNGAMVLSPFEGIKKEYDYIIIGSQYITEIYTQLREIGVKEDRIIGFFNLYSDGNLDDILGKGIFINEKLMELDQTRMLDLSFLDISVDNLINGEEKIIYVTHDMNFNGAQLLSLNIITVLREHFRMNVEIISQSGGILHDQFKKLGNIYNVEDFKGNIASLNQHIVALKNAGYEKAICNTVISGNLSKYLKSSGIEVITLIHELPGVIKKYKAESRLADAVQYSDKIVFPSRYVYDKLKSLLNLNEQKVIIRPQGLYKLNKYKGNKLEARKELRGRLGLAPDSEIVLGVGYGDERKGVDLFSQVATYVKQKRDNIHFIWVGGLDEQFISEIPDTLLGNVMFIGQTDPNIFYAGADTYLLTSREDPFPSVVIESMNVGLPVISFEGTGGFEDILNEKTGIIVRSFDIKEMGEKTIELLKNPCELLSKSNASMTLIERDFMFLDYIYDLLGLLSLNYKKVSVVVPNYNYAHYLEARINSILKQTYPIYELICLDDCSVDDSVGVLNRLLMQNNSRYLNMKMIQSEENSGSVFKQWLKGLEAVRGDFVWIAEADDLSKEIFLEKVLQGFERDDEVVLAYSQSYQIDENSYILADDYCEYTLDISQDKWRKDYIRVGVEEIKDTLVVKNTIPNVSAVVFKNSTDIVSISNNLIQYKIAGDWYFYINLLMRGKIYYCSESLNYHRRHTDSVTRRENSLIHFDEIIHIQQYILSLYDVNKDILKKVFAYREYVRSYLKI